MLSFVSCRLLLIHRQQNNIQNYAKTLNTAELQRICATTEQLIENKGQVYQILSAVNEVQPPALTDEQRQILSILRQMLKWCTVEYDSTIKFASKVKIDGEVIADLERGRETNS